MYGHETVYPLIVFVGVLVVSLLCSELLRARPRRLSAQRMKWLQRQEPPKEQDPSSLTEAKRAPHPWFKTLTSWIEEWVSFSSQAYWRDKLVQAGWQRQLRPGEFLLLRGFLMLFLPAVGGPLLWLASWERKWLLLGIGGLFLLGYGGPVLLLQGAIGRRRRILRRTLPHALDLLLAYVEAGLGFDGALQQVAQRTPGLLSEEFQRVIEDMKQGKSRQAAWQRLKERTNLPELNSLATAIVQTSQLELSLKEILRAQAYLLHRRRCEWVEEQGRRLPFRTLFLMVLLTLAALFLLLLDLQLQGRSGG